jgi:hypothetical protein
MFASLDSMPATDFLEFLADAMESRHEPQAFACRVCGRPKIHGLGLCEQHDHERKARTERERARRRTKAA